MSKVLIIDDDLTAREVLGARLESLGHAVFLEADGVAGLEACRYDGRRWFCLTCVYQTVMAWRSSLNLKNNVPRPK